VGGASDRTRRRSAAAIVPFSINKLPIDGGSRRWNGAVASCSRLDKPLRPGRARPRRQRRIGEGLALRTLLKLSRDIDACTRWIGKRLAWLILVAVIVSAMNAVVRKIFDTSSNSWLELQWLLFSIVFLMCSSWTLLDNEHIRIDIINNHLPKKLRDSIDIVGHVFFLLPLCVVMLITGVPFFNRSFEINEQSGNAGGLAQWPAKSLIMIGFAMLLVQGISELIKRIAVMRGLIPDPHAAQVNPIEAEIEHVIEAIEKR
jgi:TRAP-type mannitol/chloroaromatic compound transport system permease small subunit